MRRLLAIAALPLFLATASYAQAPKPKPQATEQAMPKCFPFDVAVKMLEKDGFVKYFAGGVALGKDKPAVVIYWFNRPAGIMVSTLVVENDEGNIIACRASTIGRVREFGPV